MDYEKKYEKLVDAVKVLRDNNPSDEGIQNWVNDNVPELKEESEDEKIRKGIISNLDNMIAYIEDSEDSPKEKKFMINDIKKQKTWLEKQGKNNMGISEDTKQKLEDNFNKALEKETPESWNEFLYKQKPTWSKEDEEMLRRCISATFDHGYLKECDWLKPLKERVQPQWKPSDEQMKQLTTAADMYPASRVCYGLKTLYEDLKKLKEE